MALPSPSADHRTPMPLRGPRRSGRQDTSSTKVPGALLGAAPRLRLLSYSHPEGWLAGSQPRDLLTPPMEQAGVEPASASAVRTSRVAASLGAVGAPPPLCLSRASLGLSRVPARLSEQSRLPVPRLGGDREGFEARASVPQRYDVVVRTCMPHPRPGVVSHDLLRDARPIPTRRNLVCPSVSSIDQGAAQD